MTPAAWYTIGVVVLVFLTLVSSRLSTDVVLLGGLLLLLLGGVLEPATAFGGFGNPGLITVGFLFVVAAGLRETGVSMHLVQRLLGQTKTVRAAQLKTTIPTTILSGFINNTPVVAVLMPVVHDWARRNQLSVSKLLIPLSYASILGGMCTLIGTSTNLIINGLLLETGHPGLGMFTISQVGVPAALVGLGMILVLAPLLLPERVAAARKLMDPREYTLEMVVEKGSVLDGQTIEAAGLRNLPGAYLIEINRDGHVLPAVGPEELLQGGDQLVFVGVVETMIDLQRVPGLQPATTQVFKLDAPRPDRVLVEAVVSNTCPLVGQTIREGRFRTYYDAVVLAVSRNGERIQSKIGDIELQPGDTLLLEALPSFVEHRSESRDFYLVSQLDGASPPRFERMPHALVILAAMVALVTTGALSMLIASMLAAAAMLLTGCLSEKDARRAADWRLLVAIGAALGIGRAMDASGAAAAIAHSLIDSAGTNPWVALAVIYAVTMVFTELITNNAAAVLVFPIAAATAASLDADLMPFAITLMIASSASFLTPIGYQTNLMVYGPGGYRFTDFLRLGLPLTLAVGAITVALVPRIWPF